MSTSSAWNPSLEIRNNLVYTADLISKPLYFRVLQSTDLKESFIALLYVSSSAAHPDFVPRAQRHASFPPEQEWMKISNGRTVEQFVDAGFYNAEPGSDHVKCFFCNLGLKDWSPGDDPFYEHVIFSPLCFYMKSTKGLQYLREVASHRSEKVRFPVVYSQADHGGLLDKIMELLKSDASKAALSAGIDSNDVLLYISRIWIRERRNPKNIIDEFQKREPGPADISLATVAESYFSSRESNMSGGNIPIEYEKSAVMAIDTGLNMSSRPQVPDENKTNGNKPSKEVSLAAESRPMSNNKPKCLVCNVKVVSITCLPCGHLCLCDTCVKTAKKCPECHTTICGVVRTHLT